jgi:hypothetical protein
MHSYNENDNDVLHGCKVHTYGLITVMSQASIHKLYEYEGLCFLNTESKL